MDGAEHVSAHWEEAIENTGAAGPITLDFFLTSDAVARPGIAEVLTNLRASKSIAAQQSVSMKVIREGHRVVAGMTGEENITTFASSGKPLPLSYAARFQSVGMANDSLRAALEISVGMDHLSVSATAPLTAQWDAMVRSVRFH